MYLGLLFFSPLDIYIFGSSVIYPGQFLVMQLHTDFHSTCSCNPISASLIKQSQSS